MLFRRSHVLTVCRMGCLFALWATGGAPAQAEVLRYKWKPQQKFSYNVTVTVDTDENITTFKGITHYEVTAANDEQVKVTYRGGLYESAQTKQSGRNSGPFGPRGMGGPFGPRGFGGPPSPFSRPSFAGKVQTTNQFVMTPTGHVLAMEGDSQLPYLLGNVSLMPFETLCKDDKQNWVVDSGVSISEENEDQRPGFGSFGPRGPFGGDDKKSVQAASEITRYTIEKDQNDLVTVKKSYQLTSPGSDKESFDMNGTGTWVFDRREHVPQSLDMSAKLIAKEGNSSTTFPITIKYERISAADLAKMETDAKLALEEKQRKDAEAKAQAEAPLTALEKTQALAGLINRDAKVIKDTLAKLAAKSPADPDPAIVVAIQRLLKHRDEAIVTSATEAMTKWSPEFKHKHDLNKAYQGPSPVASSDLEVDSQTKLVVSQLLQVQEHGSFWHPCRIKALLPGGKVVVEMLAWGKPNRDITVARRNLQLAPPEVDQPVAVAKSGSAAQTTDVAEMTSPSRSWSDKSGRFKIEASLIGIENGAVKLRRTDGKEVSVPLDKLSETDQKFLRQMQDENPFEPK